MVTVTLKGNRHFSGFIVAAVSHDSHGEEILIGSFKGFKDYTQEMCHGTVGEATGHRATL